MKFITIGEKLGRHECPYMRRWAINFYFFSVRLHHWYSSDDDRAFHDHSSFFITLIVRGNYTDITESGKELMRPGTIRYRPALHRHTVSVHEGGCWTLTLFGPKERNWGFWIKDNTKFVKSNKYFLEHGHHPCEFL